MELPASPGLDRRVLPLRSDFREMIALSVPVVTVQLGLMAMGVVDSVMVGRVSAQALAAVALGHLYFMAVIAFPMGALLALDPLVSQAVGGGEGGAVTRSVQRGLVLAAGLAIPTMLLMLPGEAVLGILRQPAEVVPLAAAYTRLCAPGVLPFLAFVVLRQTMQAMTRLRPVVATIVLGNLLNVALDAVLIFGVGDLPGLGALGSAWASTASRWFLLAGLLVAGRGDLSDHLRRGLPEALQAGPLAALVRLGAPIGVQFQLEFAAFGVIGLLMGWLGTAAVAAHQVALNLAALTFMVPLGISAAAAVLVGRSIGRGDIPGARRAAVAGLVCGAAFMSAMAVTLLTLPTALAEVFTNVAEVVAIAAVLIPLAGVFQVFDGLQVVATGILRGAADTRGPMVVNVLGFWLVGMPVSVVLGFGLELGPAGLWSGLVAGLAAVALLLLLRLRRTFAGPIDRVRLDA